MGAIEKLEEQVRKLSPEELAAFRAWFAEFDARAWDEQIRADLEAGKLDPLLAEALADYESGNIRPL